MKDIEKTRRQYHKSPTINSVHCASLMVPEIANTKVEISFLNHFLLKRNYSKVACRITPIDINGQKIESHLYDIDKPIVYSIPLTGMVDKSVSNYMIEFFSAENLFIPFPAVMINHIGNGFINQVHSYNRVLNDVFEDDIINSTQVSEASVDLILENEIDTFMLFSAGPINCSTPLEIEVLTNKELLKETYNLQVPRFGTKKISIKETFKGIPNGVKGILRVRQPRQPLFYGRMLVGQWKNDGVFSANHSYYDSSTAEEYWDDNRSSERFYPFFGNLQNIIRMYPIMSPSNLIMYISMFTKDGSLLKEIMIGDLTSPDNRFLSVSINSLIEKEAITPNDVSCFAVTVKTNSGKMPTRVSHQLVYGNGGLNTSISISLHNPNVFVPAGKKSFKWGQTITGKDYDSYVGIIADACENPNVSHQDIHVTFYYEEGKLATRDYSIPNKSAIKFKVGDELKTELDKLEKKIRNIWCVAESEHHGVNFFSIAYNKNTNNFSGDHGF